MCKQLKIIIKQIDLLIIEQYYKYSADLSAFCSILFPIILYAYKFFSKSGYVVSHEQKEQADENILKCAKRDLKHCRKHIA